MAAQSGRLSSHIVRMYMIAPQTTLTEVALAPLLINYDTSNYTEIADIIDLSSGVTNERAIIDLPIYGDTTLSKIVGQGDPGTFDISIVNDFTNTVHATILADDGTTERAFVIDIDTDASDSNRSLVYFQGYISNSELMFGQGEAVMLNMSIARTGVRTIVAHA